MEKVSEATYHLITGGIIDTKPSIHESENMENVVWTIGVIVTFKRSSYRTREELGMLIYKSWETRFLDRNIFIKVDEMILEKNWNSVKSNLRDLVDCVFSKYVHDEMKSNSEYFLKREKSLNHLIYLCHLKPISKYLVNRLDIVSRISSKLKKIPCFSSDSMSSHDSNMSREFSMFHLLFNLCFYEDGISVVKTNQFILRRILTIVFQHRFDPCDGEVSNNNTNDNIRVLHHQRIIAISFRLINRILTISINRVKDWHHVQKFISSQYPKFSYSKFVDVVHWMLHYTVFPACPYTICSFFNEIFTSTFSRYYGTQKKYFTPFASQRFIEIAVGILGYYLETSEELFSEECAFNLERDLIILQIFRYLQSAACVGKADYVFKTIFGDRTFNSPTGLFQKFIEIIQKCQSGNSNRLSCFDLLATLSDDLQDGINRILFYNIIKNSISTHNWFSECFLDGLEEEERNQFILIIDGLLGEPVTKKSFLKRLTKKIFEVVRLLLIRLHFSYSGTLRNENNISSFRHILIVLMRITTKETLEEVRALVFGNNYYIFMILMKSFYSSPLRVKRNFMTFLSGLFGHFDVELRTFFERNFHIADPESKQLNDFDLLMDTLEEIVKESEMTKSQIEFVFDRPFFDCMMKLKKLFCRKDFPKEFDEVLLPSYIDRPGMLRGKETVDRYTHPKKMMFCCGYCKARKGKMKMCSRCRHMFYCDLKCQKGHWKDHKKYCRSI